MFIELPFVISYFLSQIEKIKSEKYQEKIIQKIERKISPKTSNATYFFTKRQIIFYLFVTFFLTLKNICKLCPNKIEFIFAILEYF